MRTERGGRPIHARDSGASLVEFALILPVFMMLLFGMITVGIALNDKQQMTHATREGARYAATVPAAQSFDLNGNGTPDEAGETWAEVVRSVVRERSVDTLGDADICVSLVQGSPAAVVDGDAKYTTNVVSGTPTPCIVGQTYPVTATDNGRRVQVTATRDAEIDLVLFGSYPVTMDVEATAKSESNA